jgi:hypothetical protein
MDVKYPFTAYFFQRRVVKFVEVLDDISSKKGFPSTDLSRMENPKKV